LILPIVPTEKKYSRSERLNFTTEQNGQDDLVKPKTGKFH